MREVLVSQVQAETDTAWAAMRPRCNQSRTERFAHVLASLAYASILVRRDRGGDDRGHVVVKRTGLPDYRSG